ncbi:MAG: thiamine pyrophosphate-dependent enzyme [Burkholderiales bacterium]|nr:thiamine pyrophosphate-dependent enzyme [Burkholderiales bacterium]
MRRSPRTCFRKRRSSPKTRSTSGRTLFPYTCAAAPHDWIQITGGAIGWAFPAATGAAIACPGRRVVCLQGDGGGMYTLQALWTQARERLDVVNIVFANRRYAIPQGELAAAGARPGPASEALFDLGRPALGWTKLAEGLGLEGGARLKRSPRLSPMSSQPPAASADAFLVEFAICRVRAAARSGASAGAAPRASLLSLAPVLDQRIGGRYHHAQPCAASRRSCRRSPRPRAARSSRPPRGRTPPEGARAPPSPRS